MAKNPDLAAVRARADALKLGLRPDLPDDVVRVCEQDIYAVLTYTERLERTIRRIASLTLEEI